MNDLTLYLISYICLLSLGFFILRVLVPRDYLRYGRLSPRVTLLQALLFFAYGGFPYVYLNRDWPKVYVPVFIHLVGFALIIIGLGFLLYKIIKLGLMRSFGRGESRLLTSGMYRFSRNPQAIACGIYVLGFLTLWPSWYAAGWSALYFILIHQMILSEEDHLGRLYGQEYVNYCKSTPRYF